MPISRRVLLLGGGVCLATVATVAVGQNVFYSFLTEDVETDEIDPVQAHRLALSGSIVLVDIRRPDEWARTGSGEAAHQLDMRREDFVSALTELAGGDTDRPIALICARGVRSARLTNRLTEAGFTKIINVPEGMLGSADGPGWIARGLPVKSAP